MDLKIEYCDKFLNNYLEDVRFEQDKNFDWIQSLKKTDGKHPAPINISYKEAKLVKLFNLKWTHYDILPNKMRLTNTGNSLVLSGDWVGYHPYLKGGPLNGSYILFQIRFAWGKKTLQGTEHTLDGRQQALEMHSIHFNKNYYTIERAAKVPGGIMIIVQLYEMRFHNDVVIEKICEKLSDIREANTFVDIESFKITNLLCPFTSDYFVYWGALQAAECNHIVQWLIPRKIHSISYQQLQKLKVLLNSNLLPIQRILRKVPLQTNQTLFLVNPKPRILKSTWIQIPLNKEPGCVRLVSNF